MKAYIKTRMSNQLGLLYFLDFLVVFLGISVSFWLNEWNSNRENDRLHHMDVQALLVDLEHDFKHDGDNRCPLEVAMQEYQTMWGHRCWYQQENGEWEIDIDVQQ